MAKENIVNKWQEIDFETLKNRLTSIEDNSILIDIKSMVKRHTRLYRSIGSINPCFINDRINI